MVAPHFVPDTGELAAGKARLRREMLAHRAGIATPEAAGAVARAILDEAPPPPGAVVSGYWPMGHELDPRPLLAALSARGHAVALPVTTRRGQPLRFRQWVPGEPLVSARFGLSEPPPEAPELRPDWLLVPLLAFDRRGHRLGYGAGYYDRTLESLPGAAALGFAYAGQEVPCVPTGPGDQPLRAVATERGVIRCDAAPRVESSEEKA
ncbi:5-formyltetrahydrofolate cyclo-ligase [Roseomonas gilardii subsp. gilardii]|uniref:5-formyltetrahydrofolate cyclo-ligase n=1 Tax=Roseomonas gilardii TaxID=257708 RepID=UPI001FF8B6B7|nr:5-formyltetrahydrofolate cyclo-ligase [Roseomonas gilardii]UPG71900.1 5-formyltetrahydrofolate cyclo-ligase [Roseomonas gilardii subsp. gilardii]